MKNTFIVETEENFIDIIDQIISLRDKPNLFSNCIHLFKNYKYISYNSFTIKLLDYCNIIGFYYQYSPDKCDILQDQYIIKKILQLTCHYNREELNNILDHKIDCFISLFKDIIHYFINTGRKNQFIEYKMGIEVELYFSPICWSKGIYTDQEISIVIESNYYGIRALKTIYIKDFRDISKQCHNQFLTNEYKEIIPYPIDRRVRVIKAILPSEVIVE